MNLLPLFEWIENTGAGSVIRQSIWLFPVIQCVHLLALALLGGTILAVDLRAFGLGLTSVTAAQLDAQLKPWRRRALALLLLSGFFMFTSEAVKCFYSPPFWYKLALLSAALLHTATLHARHTRLTAGLSLALWLGTGYAGRWIAFY